MRVKKIKEKSSEEPKRKEKRGKDGEKCNKII